MEFLFYPSDEGAFKEKARGNYVRTVVFDVEKKCVIKDFCRHVQVLWANSLRNNIQTDQRIRELPGTGENYQVFSWVCQSEDDFGLPFFSSVN